jgi:Mn-dependent DtxR family transcriptional regulator
MSSVLGHVAGLDRAQEAEAVGQHLEHAVAEDLLAALGALLHDREHQFLLAQAADVLDFQRLAHLDELGDVLCLQFGQVHAWVSRQH